MARGENHVRPAANPEVERVSREGDSAGRDTAITQQAANDLTDPSSTAAVDDMRGTNNQTGMEGFPDANNLIPEGANDSQNTGQRRTRFGQGTGEGRITNIPVESTVGNPTEREVRAEANSTDGTVTTRLSGGSDVGAENAAAANAENQARAGETSQDVDTAAVETSAPSTATEPSTEAVEQNKKR